MTRKSQILNFHSKDFRKMVFAEISEYFFRENNPRKFLVIGLIFFFGCIPVALTIFED